MAELKFIDVKRYCADRIADHKGYSACNACPVHDACCSDIGSLSDASLDAWRSRCAASLSTVHGQRTVRAGTEGVVNG